MVRLDVEAPQTTTRYGCMCEPLETAQSLGDNARWLHGHSARESTDYALSVVLCVGWLRGWAIDRCSNKDAGRIERRPLVQISTVF